MKISNSKKQLAKIIHENGGWRGGANWSVQHKRPYGGRVVFTSRADKPEFETGWHANGTFFGGFDNDKTLLGWHQTILSRDEYFHLYPVAEATPEPVAELTDDERCIQEAFTPEVKPTIEQLAADYRNAKDYAERKQQEADAAKADAEAKLVELVAAGKALGLVLGVAGTEPEPVITDWRQLQVGDVISVQCFEKVYSQGTVLAVGVSDVLIRNHVGARKTVNLDERDWSFVRRPAKGETNA